MITREPIGVVGAVVPWNFPLLMASWKLGPALATGNSVILKPAEQSPLTALRMAELAAEAGLPEGVLNVLPGFGETAGQALGRHMDVDMIAFTGSTEVGKYFLRYAGESNMKHVALETGGKSPNIVFADIADINHAAATAAAGVFYNSGQVCTAATPHHRPGEDQGSVRRACRQACREMAAARIRSIPRPRWARWWMRARWTASSAISISASKEGAKVAFGGERARQAIPAAIYVEPTIFDEVKNSMRIAQEEIFGPVVGDYHLQG